MGTQATTDRRVFLKTAAAAALAVPGAALAQSAASPPAPATAPRGAQGVKQPMKPAGFSRPRIGRVRQALNRFVERGDIPGIVSLVSRRGETRVDAIGVKAVNGKDPMRRDTLFRIASMTKPITAVAAMILVEECRLRLDEPVDRLLPELADRKVLKRIDGPLGDTVPANRPISVRDLLTFRMGMGFMLDGSPDWPIRRAMAEAGVAPGAHGPEAPPDEWMKRLAALPLLHQPGERWMYHTGSEVLGVLIARAAGRSLGAFFRERIFTPLGMKDTGFSVPEASIDRLATCYEADPATGRLAVFDEARTGRFARPPAFESGGGGLVSTVDDYLAFCRMLLDKGRVGTDRILSAASVDLMTTDQITAEQKALSPFFPGFWDSRGWGFGLSVITRRVDVGSNPGRFGWDGGYGTSGYADPGEDLVGILMTQRSLDPVGFDVNGDFWTSVYQAIDE